ncbi:MAG TPA: hypothetical protein VMX75_06235 [Spirochaetia bacterium]|nr:hypothetical protein [Spirochaetia bacterium]
MSWSMIFLILGIIIAIFGIWNLARRRNLFLSLLGMILLLVILLRFYIGRLDVLVLPRLSLSHLLEFLIIPIFLILAFFSSRR